MLLGLGHGHLPGHATTTSLHLAAHSLRYVLPSSPQTGSRSSEQVLQSIDGVGSGDDGLMPRKVKFLVVQFYLLGVYLVWGTDKHRDMQYLLLRIWRGIRCRMCFHQHRTLDYIFLDSHIL